MKIDSNDISSFGIVQSQSQQYCTTMALAERDPNALSRSSLSRRSKLSDKTSIREGAYTPQLGDSAQVERSSSRNGFIPQYNSTNAQSSTTNPHPAGVLSMLKTTTETGDIGAIGIRQTRLPRPSKQMPLPHRGRSNHTTLSRTSSHYSRADSMRSRASSTRSNNNNSSSNNSRNNNGGEHQYHVQHHLRHDRTGQRLYNQYPAGSSSNMDLPMRHELRSHSSTHSMANSGHNSIRPSITDGTSITEEQSLQSLPVPQLQQRRSYSLTSQDQMPPLRTVNSMTLPTQRAWPFPSSQQSYGSSLRPRPAYNNLAGHHSSGYNSNSNYTPNLRHLPYRPASPAYSEPYEIFKPRYIPRPGVPPRTFTSSSSPLQQEAVAGPTDRQQNPHLPSLRVSLTPSAPMPGSNLDTRPRVFEDEPSTEKKRINNRANMGLQLASNEGETMKPTAKNLPVLSRLPAALRAVQHSAELPEATKRRPVMSGRRLSKQSADIGPYTGFVQRVKQALEGRASGDTIRTNEKLQLNEKQDSTINTVSNSDEERVYPQSLNAEQDHHANETQGKDLGQEELKLEDSVQPVEQPAVPPIVIKRLTRDMIKAAIGPPSDTGAISPRGPASVASAAAAVDDEACTDMTSFRGAQSMNIVRSFSQTDIFKDSEQSVEDLSGNDLTQTTPVPQDAKEPQVDFLNVLDSNIKTSLGTMDDDIDGRANADTTRTPLTDLTRTSTQSVNAHIEESSRESASEVDSGSPPTDETHDERPVSAAFGISIATDDITAETGRYSTSYDASDEASTAQNKGDNSRISTSSMTVSRSNSMHQALPIHFSSGDAHDLSENVRISSDSTSSFSGNGKARLPRSTERISFPRHTGSLINNEQGPSTNVYQNDSSGSISMLPSSSTGISQSTMLYQQQMQQQDGVFNATGSLTNPDMKLSAVKQFHFPLPDLTEDSQEDASTTNLRMLGAHTPATFRFAGQRRRLREPRGHGVRATGHRQLGKHRNDDLQAIPVVQQQQQQQQQAVKHAESYLSRKLTDSKGIPSLNFSNMDLTTKLNLALGLNPAGVIEQSKSKNTNSKDALGHPDEDEQFATAYNARERYKSFFSEDEELADGEEKGKGSQDEETIDLKDAENKDLKVSKKGTNHHEDVDAAEIISDIDRISIPSVNGLTVRLSELLPTIKDCSFPVDEEENHGRDTVSSEIPADESQEKGAAGSKGDQRTTSELLRTSLHDHTTKRESWTSTLAAGSVARLKRVGSPVVLDSNNDDQRRNFNIMKDLPLLPTEGNDPRPSLASNFENTREEQQQDTSGVSAETEFPLEPQKRLPGSSSQNPSEMQSKSQQHCHAVDSKQKQDARLNKGAARVKAGEDTNAIVVAEQAQANVSVMNLPTGDSERIARSMSPGPHMDSILVPEGKIAKKHNENSRASDVVDDDADALKLESQKKQTKTKRLVGSLKSKVAMMTTSSSVRPSPDGGMKFSIEADFFHQGEQRIVSGPGDRYPTTALTHPGHLNIDDTRSYFSDDSSDGEGEGESGRQKTSTTLRKRLTRLKNRYSTQQPQPQSANNRQLNNIHAGGSTTGSMLDGGTAGATTAIAPAIASSSSHDGVWTTSQARSLSHSEEDDDIEWDSSHHHHHHHHPNVLAMYHQPPSGMSKLEFRAKRMLEKFRIFWLRSGEVVRSMSRTRRHAPMWYDGTDVFDGT